ncbi:hypothetical protein IKF23_00080 [Candidatus Saccharibacteria bacterium]|nr:hypothetical protein [Candidatus Saccharibacteria bacterium]
MLEDSTTLKVVGKIEESKTDKMAILKSQTDSENYQLSRIITSPMKENSDIIYLYTVKGEQNGTDLRSDEND